MRAVLPILTVVALGACGGNDDETALTFAARVGSADAACGQSYDGLGTGEATGELKDLRFYVTNVRLLDASGNATPLTLVPDGVWQDGIVALLDFEDGSAGCTEGDSNLNDTILADAVDGDWDGVAFELGVPFDRNHLDVSAAEPPLDRPAMYWAWSLGYKFFRVDFDVNSGAARFNVHLGSTMCPSASPNDPPTEPCGRSNRAEIRLTGFDPTSTPIVLDVAEILDGSDLLVNTEETAFGCQSFPNDADDCTPIFEQFGLDYGSGECEAGCAGQSVFRAGP